MVSSLFDRPARRGAVIAGQATVFSRDVEGRLLHCDDGRRGVLDLRRVLAVAQGWRDAIIARSNDFPVHIRSLLSGHDSDGSPLVGPHLAFVPLARVGFSGADGRLPGMGLVLPDGLALADRRLALAATARVDRLVLGRLGVWRVRVPTPADSSSTSLRAAAWTAHPDGATQWATVTPIVFDRHPKSDDGAARQVEIATMVAMSCERIGLPDPREVIVTAASVHAGVPPSHEFPRMRRKDGSERQHAHAVLVFDEPVSGPVLLGAGRYRGYGVCRPIGSVLACATQRTRPSTNEAQ